MTCKASAKDEAEEVCTYDWHMHLKASKQKVYFFLLGLLLSGVYFGMHGGLIHSSLP